MTKASMSLPAHRAAWHPVRCLLLLPISQLRRTHGAKAIELLNFDVFGPRALVCERRRRIDQLLTRLSLLAALLRRERLFIPVELGLFPDVDLILLGSRKHVIQFFVILHGRDPVLR